ncbi:uncharacterized protein LOC132921277 isoform X2 [Rhopalosiphum padi]|uniref:uncharacterized protein LOC132921277 isoform X2 n=1 Tax=Rhopalosiphum padi TaxID=40932 RepID=UPI00298E8887|nr:uncharacterized protein LOC132921277 isoform X2 [Rhopalosiphum padi]
MSTKQSQKYREIRPYKRWVIVIFMETNDYSVVPINWLILQTKVTISNILSVHYCRWPPFNVTSNELLRADDPDDLWNSFKIKILDGKMYENFKEACCKRIEIESSARKPPKEQNNKRQRSSSEDSDFEGKKAVHFSGFPVTPPPIQIKASTSSISTNRKIYNMKKKKDEKQNERIKSNYFINPRVNSFDDLKIKINDTLNPILDNEIPDNLRLTEKLRLLFIKHNTSHNFCNSLLQILNNEGLNVPKDIRTLIKIPKINDIVDISGGSYVHLGLKNMLLPILIKNNAQLYIKSQVVDIGINIDGLTVSKNPKHHFWPILISILNFKELKENVVPIAFFHGFQKPNFIEEFLNPLIIDLLEVFDNGLNVNGFFF